MKSKKTFLLVTAILLLALVVLIILFVLFMLIMFFSNPLRGSDEDIRAHVLRETPIGTSMDETIEIIESHRRWDLRRIDYNSGFHVHPETGHLSSRARDENIPHFTGEKHVRATLGSVRRPFPFQHYVIAFWAFDDYAELIDVAIAWQKY